MSFEPQPTLAWQFESSNVESIQGLVPRAQVSPGPAQLIGSTALITNAPIVGDAVYFPGTTGSYMNASSSAIANLAGNSNIFVECWVYQMSTTPYGQGIISTSQTSQQWILRTLGGIPSIYIGGGPVTGGNFTSGAIPLNTWTHLAFSWAIGPTSNTAYCFTNGIAAGSFTMTSLYSSNPGTSPIIGAYNTTETMNGYIRDIRVVKGGIVPTASFPLVRYPDPFAYTLPSYVTGTDGSVVFTLLSQFVTYPAGKFGECLRLNNGTDELNSRIEYSSLASTLNNFSIAAWVYPYSVNTARTNTFFEMKPLDVADTQFQVSAATSGKSTVAVSTNGGSITELSSVANLAVGKWTHHCLTFSNVGATIVGNVFASYYINGTLQTSSNAFTQPSSLLSNLVMGSTTTASADTGLDDFRVYDRALTSTEVSSVYLSFGDPTGPKTYAVGTSSNVTTDGDGYTIHTFTSPGTFTCTRPGVADVLVVAGGGGGGSGGGSFGGAGAGGGGVQYFPNYNIRAGGTYTVKVGTGGTGGTGPVTRGTNGNPSQFMEIVSFGGGGGGCFNQGGLFGGSGGGGGRQVPASTPGIYGQGNSGAGGSSPAGGAGGGAGSSGAGLVGGAGISYPAISTNVYGAGGLATDSANGVSMTGNGGGGNGNGSAPFVGGAGGPGVVMIRYLTQGAPQGYETVYTGETTIGSFAGYNSPTANVQVFHGPTGPGSASYTWVRPPLSTGTFARIECVGGGAGGTNTLNSTVGPLITVYMGNDMTITTADQSTVLTGAQIAGLGISVNAGSTFTSNTISFVDTTQKMITVQMNGTNIVPTVTPVVGYTLTLANTHFGTTTGVYGRGVGGSGGGYAFGTIPLTELSPTVAVSVGGGGASFAVGTASTFGPFSPLYGSITGGGATASQSTTTGGIGGIGGLSYGAVPSNIFTGGVGVPARTGTVASGPSYSAYGGSGGGNSITGTGIPSLFAGDGGVGISTTGAITPAIDGGYPGGGGGGGRSPGTIAGGRGAPGRVRIIVY